VTEKKKLEDVTIQWTVEEFQAWLATNMSSPAEHKRVILWAKRVLKTLPIEPQDLVSEAVLRILLGDRKLNRAWPIEVNVYGVLRSIASSWHKRRKRKPEISLEELMMSDDDKGTDALEVLLLPSDARAPSAEEELSYKQEMNAMTEVFKDRPDAQMVLMGQAEGIKGAALAEFADINPTQLASVQRLISRRLAGYGRDE
jgi:DNA-directed RNA polymerase specialized sigma24 family protein